MCQTDTSARAYLYVLDACFSEDDKALFLFGVNRLLSVPPTSNCIFIVVFGCYML